MLLESTVFLTVIVLIACAIIGGLFLLCCHTREPHEGAPRKKPLLSNWK